MIDDDDIEMKIMGYISFFLLLVIAVIATIDIGFLEPERAEDAVNQCNNLGASSYVSYKGKLFDNEAYGVRCEYPETTSNINLNNANPLVQINSDN